MNNMSKKQEIIGLIDADLLDNGTRHPNLVLPLIPQHYYKIFFLST